MRQPAVRSWIVVGLAALTIGPLFGQVLPEMKKFKIAEQRIVRLSPSAFPGLPDTVVRELLRRGCTIPQSAYPKHPHNVVKGEFARPGQTDWAVLCSTKGVSSILVFWNGTDQKVAAIAPMEDRNYLQVLSPTEIDFSRSLAAVGKDVIMRHYQAYGGPKPPPMDHQGIDDAFLEKASITWYFHAGKWLKLTGSD